MSVAGLRTIAHGAQRKRSSSILRGSYSILTSTLWTCSRTSWSPYQQRIGAHSRRLTVYVFWKMHQSEWPFTTANDVLDLRTFTILPGFLHPYSETSWEVQVTKEPVVERTIRATAHWYAKRHLMGTESAGGADTALRSKSSLYTNQEGTASQGSKLQTDTKSALMLYVGTFGQEPRHKSAGVVPSMI
ncbi:hypothetical protein PAXRUDRAFT_443473 [Paxillus rubicundulus Ve08.2h10]|uniref:Uncharacterized protein n=1 Tax=Paxillus rubicundulus Ve08.2h10 TaxID=930991 RepID=A0A0D0DX05_9AGAM|nr:hypothetical protein PAXRUDRAFT_443473 [Paxillus rubicundulus Ve08.2h10]